jgi:hypothetical protein
LKSNLGHTAIELFAADATRSKLAPS